MCAGLAGNQNNPHPFACSARPRLKLVTVGHDGLQEFQRLDDSAGVAVFSIDFEAILKREQLVKWLVETWGPVVRHAKKCRLLPLKFLICFFGSWPVLLRLR